MTKILFLSAIVLAFGSAMAQDHVSMDEPIVIPRALAITSPTLSEYCHENPTASILYYKQTFKCADLIKV